jgi:hypothetical protein
MVILAGQLMSKLCQNTNARPFCKQAISCKSDTEDLAFSLEPKVLVVSR